MTTTTQTTILRRDGQGRLRIDEAARETLAAALVALLDAAVTSLGRATFYNTREEQEAAEEATHRAVLDLDRGVYAAVLALPGVNDHTTQVGLRHLLARPNAGPDAARETRLLTRLADRLPPQRLIKFFCQLAARRVNNRRARRLVLDGLLRSERFPFWAVKYRRKLRVALRHALGVRQASLVRTLTDTPADDRRLDALLGRHLPDAPGAHLEALNYVLGGRREPTLPLLRAVRDARTDLDAGADLPFEVLAGIRSRFHKGTPHAAVLKLAQRHGTLSTAQKVAMQRSAEEQGVKLDFDPARADAIRLYVLALEVGITPAMREALDDKARRAANALPLRHERVGIVVDTSASMRGTAEGQYRPLATVLHLRDVLRHAATEARVIATGGAFDENGLARPEGDTDLAAAVATLLQDDLDAIFLLTDGYENTPAGRVDEVLAQAASLGVRVPVYQLTPVLSAEKQGVRALSTRLTALPVSRVEALPLALVRAAVQQDPERGLEGLFALARPMLEEVRP